MSIQQDNGSELSIPSQHLFLTSQPAAAVVGVTRATLVKYLLPDAWYESAKGDKTHPLWLRATVEAFKASYVYGRAGGAE
jgi:hypothetical protein